jgi:hypothetical protein
MKYNINVIKSVWRRLRKPSRATLVAFYSQKAVYTQPNPEMGAQIWSNPTAGIFGSRKAEIRNEGKTRGSAGRLTRTQMKELTIRNNQS